MTPEEIVAKLNDDTIKSAAGWAARMLHADGYALVELAPGDATLYKVVVIAPGVPKLTWAGVVHTSEYLVTLVNCDGASYPWSGTRMHYDYVTVKWVNDDRLWTGVVLTEFLNALADALSEEDQ